jgi:hypothetical protein
MKQVLLLFIFSCTLLKSQQDVALFSVYLVGDAGRDTMPSETMYLLAYDAISDTSSAVLILGDNCYPAGLTEKESQKKISERKLAAQIELFSTYRGLFKMIPGNHDWNAGRFGGYAAVLRQKKFVDDYSKVNSINKNAGSVYFSSAGLPGPEITSLSPAIKLLSIDSQWFLHFSDWFAARKLNGKRIRETENEFWGKLKQELDASKAAGQYVIIAAHHPLFTNGSHAHRRQPIRFLVQYTPLRLFATTLNRTWLAQDIDHAGYSKYRRKMLKLLKDYQKVIYVSGHEHNMQYFNKSGNSYIVSGCGSKLSPIDRYRFPAEFMEDQQSGFFKLQFFNSGKVVLGAFGTRERGLYWSKTIYR